MLTFLQADTIDHDYFQTFTAPGDWAQTDVSPADRLYGAKVHAGYYRDVFNSFQGVEGSSPYGKQPLLQSSRIALLTARERFSNPQQAAVCCRGGDPVPYSLDGTIVNIDT